MSEITDGTSTLRDYSDRKVVLEVTVFCCQDLQDLLEVTRFLIADINKLLANILSLNKRQIAPPLELIRHLALNLVG